MNNVDLREEFVSVKNLVQAWERVRKNKGSAGIDGVTIDKFEIKTKMKIYYVFRIACLKGHTAPLLLFRYQLKRHLPKSA